MLFKAYHMTRNENVTALIKEILKFNKIIKIRINMENNNNIKSITIK